MPLAAQRPRLRTGLIAAVMVGFVAVLGLISSPAARAATPGTFTELTSSPTYINGVVTDPTTNLIYAQQNGGTSFYRYNPTTNAWSTLASAPISMENNAGAAYLNGKIYVGYCPPSSGVAVYDIATNTWSTVTSLSGYATADIAAVGGLIYIADRSQFVSYNPSTGTTQTLATPPAFSETGGDDTGFEPWGSLVPYKGKLYGTEGNGYNGFAVYDIASNSWTQLPNVPVNSGGDPGETGAALGGAIDPITGTFYTYGAYDGGTWDMYNIAKGTWTTTPYPYHNLGDGGLAYVSTPGLQGIYSTTGESDSAFGFYRYNTQAGATVSISARVSPHTVTVGKSAAYTVKVKNGGNTSASNVKVTDKLPSGVKLVKASTTAGKCTGKRTVVCKLGTVKAGHIVTIKLLVTARRAGKAKDTAVLATTSFNLSTHTSASATLTVKKAAKKKSTGPVFTG